MKLFSAVMLFLCLSDIALAGDVGSATFNIDRKNLPGSITGKGAHVFGSYTLDGKKVAGKFTLRLSEFDAGMALLSKHLCEHLECTTYPDAVFDLKSFEMKDGDVEGTLTLHGKTLPVTGWKAEVDGHDVTVKGSVKLTDYGITPPEFSGVGVSNKADVTIEVKI